MTNSLAYSISSQIPEYIATEFPKFAQFLELYYEHEISKNNPLDITHNNYINTDIDNADDTYIDRLYSVYHQTIPPHGLLLDKRNFLKIVNKIYESKGTEKSLRILFRILFGEEINITYPKDNILIASGGEWYQEKFVTLRKNFGTLPELPYSLVFTSSAGAFAVSVIRTEEINTDLTRFYFISFQQLNLIHDQIVYVYDANNVPLYGGILEQSAVRIAIRDPGKDWQVGQIVIIDGTISPSVIRITKVSSTGGIESAEVLIFGYEHTPNQITIISPYPSKPQLDSSNLVSTLDHIDDTIPGSPVFVYSHALTIADNLDKQTESIGGVSSGLHDGIAIVYESKVADQNYSIVDPQSITDWYASLATFELVFDLITNTRGYYTSDSGKISNQEIKLQDNYYYQLYSYVVNSSQDISNFGSWMDIIHPAGTKSFFNINKTVNFNLGISSSRTLSNDVIYFVDVVPITEMIGLHFTKKASDDSVTAAEPSSENFFDFPYGIDGPTGYFAEDYSYPDTLTLTIGN